MVGTDIDRDCLAHAKVARYGAFAFTDIDDAAAAIEEIEHDYPRHCRAARRVAEHYLDGTRVIQRVLDGAV